MYGYYASGFTFFYRYIEPASQRKSIHHLRPEAKREQTPRPYSFKRKHTDNISCIPFLEKTLFIMENLGNKQTDKGRTTVTLSWTQQ